MPKLTSFIPQWNWTKLGLYAAVMIGLLVVGFFIGTGREKAQCASKHAEDIAVLMAYQQGQIDEYNRELKERIRVANEASQTAAALRNQLMSIQGEIDNEIDSRNPVASCGPTEREHELYKEIARKTRNQ